MAKFVPGLPEPDLLPGRPKWLRYERMYSNAMWHVDWHETRDPRLERLNLAGVS